MTLTLYWIGFNGSFRNATCKTPEYGAATLPVPLQLQTRWLSVVESPKFCFCHSLRPVLCRIHIEPQRRWKGVLHNVWYFHTELLGLCCVSRREIHRRRMIEAEKVHICKGAMDCMYICDTPSCWPSFGQR